MWEKHWLVTLVCAQTAPRLGSHAGVGDVLVQSEDWIHICPDEVNPHPRYLPWPGIECNSGYGMMFIPLLSHAGHGGIKIIFEHSTPYVGLYKLVEDN